MRIVIDFDEKRGQFQMNSDGTNFSTIAALELAKAALIKKGMEEGTLANIVRRVDIPR